jgi:hypothetical protein
MDRKEEQGTKKKRKRLEDRKQSMWEGQEREKERELAREEDSEGQKEKMIDLESKSECRWIEKERERQRDRA